MVDGGCSRADRECGQVPFSNCPRYMSHVKSPSLRAAHFDNSSLLRGLRGIGVLGSSFTLGCFEHINWLQLPLRQSYRSLKVSLGLDLSPRREGDASDSVWVDLLITKVVDGNCTKRRRMKIYCRRPNCFGTRNETESW